MPRISSQIDPEQMEIRNETDEDDLGNGDYSNDDRKLS